MNNLIAELTRVQGEFKALRKESFVMKRNMSSLLQTAKNEMKRKDSEIASLRKE